MSFVFIPAIQQEKTEEELKSGISQFNRNSLKKTQTQEKTVLPDQSSEYDKCSLTVRNIIGKAKLLRDGSK